MGEGILKPNFTSNKGFSSFLFVLLFTFNILTEYYTKPIKVARYIRSINEMRYQGFSDLLRGVELQFIMSEVIFL